jgi:hypothetical protein
VYQCLKERQNRERKRTHAREQNQTTRCRPILQQPSLRICTACSWDSLESSTAQRRRYRGSDELPQSTPGPTRRRRKGRWRCLREKCGQPPRDAWREGCTATCEGWEGRRKPGSDDILLTSSRSKCEGEAGRWWQLREAIDWLWRGEGEREKGQRVISTWIERKERGRRRKHAPFIAIERALPSFSSIFILHSVCHSRQTSMPYLSQTFSPLEARTSSTSSSLNSAPTRAR